MSTRYLVTFDPGTEEAGLALFDEQTQRLARAMLIKATGPDVFLRTRQVARQAADVVKLWAPSEAIRVAIELPQIYKRGPKSNVKSENILVLVMTLGGFWHMLRDPEHTVMINPGAWKGQVKKETFTKIILGSMKPEERAITAPLKDDHNVIDAVGLGLYVYNRLP